MPGSAINLPLVRLKSESSEQESNVRVDGMPTVIPTIVAIHMLVQFQIYLPVLLCVALVAAIVHRFARPIPGVGIGLPGLVAPVQAAASTWLFPEAPAPSLAYVAGTFDGIFSTGILAVVLACGCPNQGRAQVSPAKGR